MHKHVLSFGSLCLLVVSIAMSTGVHAVSLEKGIVISQLLTGGSATGTAGQEFIELFNASQNDITINNWCVTYASSSDAVQLQIGCFTPADAHTELLLSAGGFALLASPDFVTANPSVTPDVVFGYVSGMAAGGGHVRLFDADKNEIDRLGWGTAVHPEGTAAAVSGGGKSLQRIIMQGIAQDSDNNAVDFAVSPTPQLHASNVIEQVVHVDICSNIDGQQDVIPDGYVSNGDGTCSIPPDDLCPNIVGVQAAIPSGYVVDSSGQCTLVPPETAQLDITELLPNPSGSDKGNEFLEIYNPNGREVRLHGYVLAVGPNFERSYPLPDESLTTHGYRALYDDELGFTLINSTSRVRLIAPAGNVVSESAAYENPTDDLAWAMINGSWQYTTQLTPGAPNRPTPPDDPPLVVPTPSTCPTGKYRNPLTNRCRAIEADAILLTSCGEGEYRNPETNRCRKLEIATSTLTPCGTGQERNPDTDRCKNVATTDNTLKPCAPGQTRNPDTQRCRKIATATHGRPLSQSLAQKTSPLLAISEWALVGVLGTAVVGYGIFEWRHEIAGLYHKALAFVSRGR